MNKTEINQKYSKSKQVFDCYQISFLSHLEYMKSSYANKIKLSSEGLYNPRKYNIGSFEGKIESNDIFFEDFKIKIENFSDVGGSVSAFRYKFYNTTKSDLSLNRIIIEISTKDLLNFLKAKTVDNLDFVKQARQKNDIPGSFNLAVNDSNLKDASFMSMNTEAGAGINFNEQASESCCPDIYSEPFLYVKNNREKNASGLLIGAFGQKKQLCDVVVKSDHSRKKFERFDVIVNFDGILLNPNSVVESEWILFIQDDNCWSAMDIYYGSLAEYYKVPLPPGPEPSIYCSWYFYGSSLTEEDLDENLEFLKMNPVPFDVFLLDLGWFNDMGLWEPNNKWPSGMAAAADKIKKAGYKPGIWTSPFVVMADSPIIQDHPELVAKDLNGDPVKFGFRDAPAYAIDPTCSFAEEYLTNLFTKLKNWGYNYHKLDFLRSVEQDDSIRFYDKTATRAQAYVRGMSIINNSVGNDGYIIACGGLFEASAGLVHAVRSGSDVRGEWYDQGVNKSSYVNRIKQNVFRNPHNRLWHTDPDALMIRVNDQPWKNSLAHHHHLSAGSLTDEEAFTTVVNQFLGDGIVCFSERLKSVQPERLGLLRHVIPTVNSKTIPHDVNNTKCPSVFLTRVKPSCTSFNNSLLLTVCNWHDKERNIQINLSEIDVYDKQAVFEFKEQKFYGVKSRKEIISIKIPLHGARVFRLTQINDNNPYIIGTNLHITSGLLEIEYFEADSSKITAKISSPWNCAVNVTALFDPQTKPAIISTTVQTNTTFAINKPYYSI